MSLSYRTSICYVPYSFFELVKPSQSIGVTKFLTRATYGMIQCAKCEVKPGKSYNVPVGCPGHSRTRTSRTG
jgi:hypothetical protein